jgi:hypothetical protein
VSFTNYMENKILDHLFGGETSPYQAAYWLGLSTSAPAEDGTNFSEPSVAFGYGRAQIDANNTVFPAAVAGSIKNGGVAVSFSKATTPWGTITHFGIFDASSGGNLLAYAALTTPHVVLLNNVLTIPVDELVINLD